MRFVALLLVVVLLGASVAKTTAQSNNTLHPQRQLAGPLVQVWVIGR